jgi:hypothetical protein
LSRPIISLRKHPGFEGGPALSQAASRDDTYGIST